MENTRLSTNNYHKDSKSGLVQQFTKIKPNQRLKGSTLVELFDAETGDKVSEQRSENLFNDSFNKYMYQLAIEMLVGGGMGTLGTGLSGSSNLFGNMVLTDYAGAEDATLKRIQGNIVGWASKTTVYAGADTKRGTVNLASSTLHDPTSISFVFDWPTTAGNGTFQTVWWMPSNITPTTSPYRHCRTGLNTTISSNMISYSKFCIAMNDLYYLRDSDDHIVRQDRNPGYQYITYAAAVDVKNSLGDDSVPRGIDWDGTHFWVYGTQNGKFYKYDTSFNLVTSWNCAYATYFNSPQCQFCCHGGYIYTYKRVNATTWNLYKFDTAGALQATYNIYGAYTNFTDTQAAGTYTSLSSDGNSLFLIETSGTYLTKVLEVTGAGVYVIDVDSDTVGSASLNTCFDEYGYLYYNYTTNLYIGPLLYTPITQNLLGVSTTKTSSNTMKITYEFTLDLSPL